MEPVNVSAKLEVRSFTRCRFFLALL